MYELSDRIQRLREEAVNSKTYMKNWGLQRHLYYTLGACEARLRGETNTEIVASGMTRTIDSFTPVIIPGEILVGFTIGEGEHYFIPQEETACRRALTDNGATPEDIEKFLAFVKEPPANPVPDPEPDLTEEEIRTQQDHTALGWCCSQNHSVIAYKKILEKGYEGMLREVEEGEKKNGPLPIYRAMKRICLSACDLGKRYADKARELLQQADSDHEKADLEAIIRICDRVPRHPATSFIEAAQSLLFAHILNTWEDDVNANSLGRLDQILYPYYAADREKGILTDREAFEIICALWIKLYRDYDVQQSCIGGTDAEGNSQVNPLSYLMLDATEALGFVRCLSVRYSARTEKEFLRRALEVTANVGKGVPFFFNDDVMIPALEYKKIPHEDACGYTQIGCVETVIPGKSNPHAVSGQINVLKTIEYILCDGYNMNRPELKSGLSLGDYESLDTYESFCEAVKKQMAYMFDQSCIKIKKTADAWVHVFPRPYKSLLTEGCIERGLDFNNKGALYDYYQVCICGIPNLADSLTVIKKFVYDDKRYTLTELKEILLGNFADEAVRQEFVRKAPKYGNDIEEVDSLAARITDYACDLLEEYSDKYHMSYHAQPFTFLWMIDHGHATAASPDGRRAGEPLAYSCSAMQGRDHKGLTALLNSICGLPGKKAPGTISAIVETDPKLFSSHNIDLMTDTLIAAGKKGLSNVQFNIVDADTLIDAQKHPEHYSNLAVRVSGFSQKFNLLSPELQNHIIGRTKHQCL